MCPELQRIDKHLDWPLCEAVVRLLAPRATQRYSAVTAALAFQDLIRRLASEAKAARCEAGGGKEGP